MKKFLLFACGLLGGFGVHAGTAEVQVKKTTVQANASGGQFIDPFAMATLRTFCAPNALKFSEKAAAPMVGNYTINKYAAASATNFISFTAAAQSLQANGVSGKVTITVVPGTGPYNEQVDLLSIPGVSATNRVIFQGNGNTLTAIPTAQKSTVLKLDNADYVKINNLKITVGGTPSTNGPVISAVQLVNNSDNDTISNCTITMPNTGTLSDYYLGIYAGLAGGSLTAPDLDAPGNNTNNSVFLNNTIKGGLYGIKINGNAGGTNAVNNRILNNTIEDFNRNGISLLHVDGSLVEGNELRRPGLPYPNTAYVITLAGESKNTRISRNRIHNLYGGMNTVFSASTYGLYFAGTGAPVGSENIASNNIIQDTNTPGTVYGIYNQGNSGIYSYYNTIYTANPGTAYGFYQTQTALNIKFINNNISINSTGSANKYALYFNSNASVIQSNNNNLHVGSPAGGNVGFYNNAAFQTLANWKAANSNAWDQQSVSAEPYFQRVAVGNLTPTNSVLNNSAQPVPAVTTDFTGTPRNATTPDLGAYEFSPTTNDVGVIAIVSPTSGCGLSNQETITVTLQNFAATTQTSIPVGFQINGGAFLTETYTGSLAYGATANFTFTAKANLMAQGPHTILVKTALPGDGQANNDATSVTINNMPQASLPTLYDFETATSGITALRTVTNSHSAVTESPAASFGTGSAKGLMLEGIDHFNWVVPGTTTNPWTMNPKNFAAAYVCLATAGGAPTDSLWLTFDLKQLFKGSNNSTNFRVTVNGVQVGPTYRPPFSGSPIAWQKVKIDLTSYKNRPTVQIGFESSVKEGFDSGNGTANLLDNIKIQRRIVSGMKEDLLLKQVTVFPNPSNGLFQVSLPGAKTYTLEVTDLVGKTVSKTDEKVTAQVNLQGFAKGTYLLKISGENGAAVRKLLVE